jgi:hypothetical protein
LRLPRWPANPSYHVYVRAASSDRSINVTTGSYSFTNIAVGTYTPTVFNYNTLWGTNITPVLTQASASHPPELPGLDLPLDTVPEGWPRQMTVSVLQMRMRF